MSHDLLWLEVSRSSCKAVKVTPTTKTDGLRAAWSAGDGLGALRIAARFLPPSRPVVPPLRVLPGGGCLGTVPTVLTFMSGCDKGIRRVAAEVCEFRVPCGVRLQGSVVTKEGKYWDRDSSFCSNAQTENLTHLVSRECAVLHLQR